MSAVALLPDDLLADILCLAAGSLIRSKLAVAQVSSRWRTIAFNTPLLWTHTRISGKSCDSEIRFLPLVLARTGPSAPLDVELSGPFFRIDSARRAEALVSFVARIRVLEIKENPYLDVCFDALLRRGLDFTALEVLRVQSARENSELHLTAPNLRELDVSAVRWSAMAHLVSRRLESVSMSSRVGSSLPSLEELLALCPNIAHLLYDGFRCHAEGRWDILPQRKLPLSAPCSRIIKIFENAIDGEAGVPRTIEVEVFPIDDDDLGPNYQQLLHIWNLLLIGLGPLVELAREQSDRLTLSDDAGHERTIALEPYPPSFDHVWRLLSEKYGAHRTLRQLTISPDIWDNLAGELAHLPPAAVQVLRVCSIPARDAFGLRNGRTSRRKLVLPALRRVEFHAMPRQAGPWFPVRMVVVRVLESVICDTGRTIEVALNFPEEINGIRDAIADINWAGG